VTQDFAAPADLVGFSAALARGDPFRGLEDIFMLYIWLLGVCLPRAYLPEITRIVLETDEELFRVFAQWLAKNKLLRPYFTREGWLMSTDIVLGYARPDEGRYETEVESPLCRERYGSSWGVFSIAILATTLRLGLRCAAGHKDEYDVAVAYVRSSGETTTHPPEFYILYHFLYRHVGTGARPLLDLAEKAEQAGDKGLADMLKRLYALLEASKDIIEEIEKMDYSHIEVRVKREIEGIAKRATELLREAKEAARKGDREELDRLLNTAAINITGYRIKLGSMITELYDRFIYDIDYPHHRKIASAVRALKRADIYEAIITVAEHFGLEVKRK